MDIFIANGHIYPNVETLHRESHFREEKNLYYNLGNGTFADITEKSGPATREKTVGRGLAYGDLLNDGSLDIVINNLNSTPNLLINRGKKGNWITLKLVGTASNRDAIGARVEKLRQGLWIRRRKCEAAAAICHRVICAFILDWAACKQWMPSRCAGPTAAKRPLRQKPLTKSLNSKRGRVVDAVFA